MAHFVSNKDETARLFENSVLEYFSHIHPATPFVVYIPVSAYLLYLGFLSVDLVYGILTVLGGVLLWTIFEYSFHRWGFHFPAKSERGKKIIHLIHGIHHDYPRDHTRLVMPLMVSIPLATLFYFIFLFVFGVYHFNVFAGFIIGYMFYDFIHYATHHYKMTSRLGRFLKEYHLRHHYTDSETAYGISSPLWDFLFRTLPPFVYEEQKAASK
jgi:sterol desaturase/sphingolipid hydroxylase (fatty acid hydroxylase superfamily)